MDTKLASSPILSVQDLRHMYGARTVLSIGALHVAKGELLTLVGPSGAGKSTLLRLLNFLEAPFAGQICYHGTPYGVRSIPMEVRRRIATVFQRPMLLDMSVRRNVGYGLRLRGERDGRALVDAALAAVGLTELAEARARTLSGGEAQRVALARALVLGPEVLLMDEPTANLDPANVRLIEQIIATANREQGTTIVLVTHNVWQARRLAQRVAFLYEGELLEVAPAADFFDHPRHPQAAAFLSGELVY